MDMERVTYKIMLIVVFILLLISSLFIDTELSPMVIIVSAFLAIDEIVVFLSGYVNGKEDERQKRYKQKNRR